MNHLIEFRLSSQEIITIMDIVRGIEIEFIDVDLFGYSETDFWHKPGLKVLFMHQSSEITVIFRLNAEDLSGRLELEKEFTPIKNWIIENILNRVNNLGFYVSYAVDYSLGDKETLFHRFVPSCIELTSSIYSDESQYLKRFKENIKYTTICGE